MRSIQRRFNNLQHKYPLLSSYTNFIRAIRGNNFSKDTISRWFNILVDKNDYENSDKKLILKHIEKLSKPPEDNEKWE